MSEEKIEKIKELAANISESKGAEKEIKALEEYLSSIEDKEVIGGSFKNLGNIGQLPTVLRLLRTRVDEIELIEYLTEKSDKLSDPMSSPENRNQISTLKAEIKEKILIATPTMIDLAIVHYQKLNDTKFDFVLGNLQQAKQDKSKFIREISSMDLVVIDDIPVKKVEKHKGRMQGLKNIFQKAKNNALKEDVIKVTEKEVRTVELDTNDMDVSDFVEEDATLVLVGLEEEATGLRKVLEDFKSKNSERKAAVLDGLQNLSAKVKKLLSKPPISEQFVSLAVKLSNQKKDSLMSKRYNAQLEKLIKSSNREDLIKAEKALGDLAFRASPSSGVKDQDKFRTVAESVNLKISNQLDAKDTENYEPLPEVESAAQHVEQPETSSEPSFTDDEAGLRSILNDIYEEFPHIKFVDALLEKVNEFDEKNHKKEKKHYSVEKESINELRSLIVSQLNDLLSKSKDPENIKKAVEAIRSHVNKEGNSIARHAALLNVVSVLQSSLEMPVKSQRVLETYQSGISKARVAVQEARKDHVALADKENTPKTNK